LDPLKEGGTVLYDKENPELGKLVQVDLIQLNL
jgi:hypothetical protein